MKLSKLFLIVLPVIAVNSVAGNNNLNVNDNDLRNKVKQQQGQILNNRNTNRTNVRTNSSAGAYNFSPNSASNGGNSMSADDNGKSYAIALPTVQIPQGNSGINILGVGGSWMSSARKDMYLINLLGQKGITIAQKQGACALLSAKVRNAITLCNRPARKNSKLTIDVTPFKERNDNSIEDEEFGSK